MCCRGAALLCAPSSALFTPRRLGVLVSSGSHGSCRDRRLLFIGFGRNVITLGFGETSSASPLWLCFGFLILPGLFHAHGFTICATILAQLCNDYRHEMLNLTYYLFVRHLLTTPYYLFVRHFLRAQLGKGRQCEPSGILKSSHPGFCPQPWVLGSSHQKLVFCCPCYEASQGRSLGSPITGAFS